jgi:ATP-dependent protease ClpP protease subunit
MKKNSWYKFSSYHATNSRKEGEVFDALNGLLIDIEGVVGDEITASQFRRDLEAQGDIQELTVRINSGGGSVCEGWAVANVLDEVKCHKIAIVSGWAASMASVIACVCDEVRIYGNSWLVIHNPWSALQGDSRELRKTADVLDAMREGMISIYSKYTSKSREEIAVLLDAETWIQGSASKADGWTFAVIENIDNKKENAQMQLNLKGLKNLKNLPAALMQLAGSTAPEVAAEVSPAEIVTASAAEIVPPVEAVVDSSKFEAQIAELKTQFEAKLSELETTKLTALNELDGVKAELLQAKAALAKLSPGLQAPEPEVSDFKEAMKKCNGNYQLAAKTYPDAYNKTLRNNK